MQSKVTILFFCIFSSTCPLAAAWHAFADQEALPTLQGSNLDASLILPNTEFSATTISPGPCSIALTSFRKLAKGNWCFLGQDLCSLQVQKLVDVTKLRAF